MKWVHEAICTEKWIYFWKKSTACFFLWFSHKRLLCFVYVIVIEKNSAKFEADDYLTDKISCWRNTEANDKFHD